MYPVGSNGASQAMLDARCLADLLAREAPEAALAAYEADRLPKTATMINFFELLLVGASVFRLNEAAMEILQTEVGCFSLRYLAMNVAIETTTATSHGLWLPARLSGKLGSPGASRRCGGLA